MPVLVGVQVHAALAAPQPHVVAVLELLHLPRAPLESRGGGFLVSWRSGEEKRKLLLVQAPRQSISRGKICTASSVPDRATAHGAGPVSQV
jgi:hypothetical protein